MDQNHELITQIHDQLENANDILVVTHVRPDGDAIGSLLGIGLALKNNGKTVQMVLSDGVPEDYIFLEGSEFIKKEPTGKVGFIIVVDSADLARTDNIIMNFGMPDLNIDHHVTNDHFARINLVVEEAVATAEILGNHLEGFGLKLTRSIANALLTGIVTDTIGFRTSNMRPEALYLSADLMEMGADLSSIYYRTIEERSFEAARYWGAGLTKLQMEDGLVWTALTLAERNAIGYPYQDDADLIKILSAIEGAKIAIIFTEHEQGYVKISWRLCGSLPTRLDVSKIAQSYGGGGHKAAAGADVEGSLIPVMEMVLTDTRNMMNLAEKPIMGKIY